MLSTYLLYTRVLSSKNVWSHHQYNLIVRNYWLERGRRFNNFLIENPVKIRLQGIYFMFCLCQLSGLPSPFMLYTYITQSSRKRYENLLFWLLILVNFPCWGLFVLSHNIYENKAEEDKNFVCKFMCKVVDIVCHSPYFNVISILYIIIYTADYCDLDRIDF